MFFLFSYKNENFAFSEIIKPMFGSPILGIYGIYDNFPLIIILQIFFMIFLTKIISMKEIISYTIVVLSSNIVLYLLNVCDKQCLINFVLSFAIYYILFIILFRKIFFNNEKNV